MALPLDGKTKVSLSLVTVGVLFIAGVYADDWLAQLLDGKFISVAAAQAIQAEQSAQIKEAVDVGKQAAQAAQATAAALSEHIRGQELKEARARLDQLRADLSTTQLWESANGANDLSRARKRDLENSIERTRAYLVCLEEARQSCTP